MQHREAANARRVVVGVDGSAESSASLEWAANAVGSGGVVHAVSVVPRGLELAAAAVQYDSAKLVAQRTRDLESWVSDLRGRGVQVVCTVVEDDVVDALLRVASEIDADLLAVGVHAKPALGPRSVGRVTTKLVHRTDRALVVVDSGSSSTSDGETAVVVGVGDGAATQAAVRWAADHAEHSGTALSLVRAVRNRPVFGTDGLLDVAAFYIDPQLLVEWATDDLVKLAEEIQLSTESDLEISHSVQFGEPGRRLVEEGEDGTLLVVGRHGNRVQPMLHHVLTHAPCPVVVVPPPGNQA